MSRSNSEWVPSQVIEVFAEAVLDSVRRLQHFGRVIRQAGGFFEQHYDQDPDVFRAQVREILGEDS